MVPWCRATLLSPLSLGLAPPLSTSFRQLPPRFKFWCTGFNISNVNNVKNLMLCVRRGLEAKNSQYGYYYRGNRVAVDVSAISMDGPPPGYRPNVGVCLVNSNNQVFVASRLDVPGAWQMPQGGVDERETPRDAAIRELREETGVSSAEILAEVPHWLTYDFPPAVKEKIDRLWGGDWKGQAQKWFLLKFTGGEDEINLAGDGTEAAEFSDWTWMPPEQVIEQAVDFKRPVYEQVFRFFGPHLGAQL
uniref:Nudix hydrolase domain-containing protein n=1 Tax=Araucaria cunninghamii TaxID=56994 RepID=A0A0D6R635_ARACU